MTGQANTPPFPYNEHDAYLTKYRMYTFFGTNPNTSPAVNHEFRYMVQAVQMLQKQATEKNN